MSTSDDQVARDERADVAVVGLGYVGLTLAAALADTGLTVLGVETDRATAAAVRAGQAPFVENGLDEALAALPNGRLLVRESMPDRLPPAVVICVGTPVDPRSSQPDLAGFTRTVDTSRRGCHLGRWWWCAAPSRWALRSGWCCRSCPPGWPLVPPPWATSSSC